jgi:hypothetical protein
MHATARAAAPCVCHIARASIMAVHRAEYDTIGALLEKHL